MIYVLRKEASESAKMLSEGLDGLRIRRVEQTQRGLRVFQRREGGNGFRARRGDTIICWGDEINDGILGQLTGAGIKVLNGKTLPNKMVQAQILKRAGVATVEVSETIRANRAGVDPLVQGWQDLMRDVPHPLDRAAIQRVLDGLTPLRNAPIPPREEWFGRRFNHIGGRDLLNPPDDPDYWTKKENIREEYRIHMFNGKSIRAGIKVPREGRTPNEWIRSDEGGWFVRYDEFRSKRRMREAAAAAVAALGLNFGAVDLGKKDDRSIIVLEVNRAPGLSDNTVTSYVDAIENANSPEEGDDI